MNDKISSMHKRDSIDSGFTIVELLVVIVVIGILAAVTIVSYTGINSKAIVASLKTDLTSASRQLKMYNVIHGEYPSDLDGSICPSGATPADSRYCFKLSGDNAKDSYTRPTQQTFTLVIRNGTKYYQITESTSPVLAPIFASGGTIASSGGYRIHTFNTDTTVTAIRNGSIEVTANGAGGGGGRADFGDESPGDNGDSVVATLSVSNGDSFNVVIGQGGLRSFVEDTTGGAGGAGCSIGSNGGSGGKDYSNNLVKYGFSYGGSGGGGSTGLKKGATCLVEARGGNGGNSGSGHNPYEGELDWWGGGGGGSGGGSNSPAPALTTSYAGGSGGPINNNGNPGGLVIRYSE